MRKIKEVLRLHFDSHLGQRPICLYQGLSRTTVGDYFRQAVRAELSWPLLDSLSDQELEHRLFPPVVAVPTVDLQLPDWSQIHTKLKRKGVSLMLLWEEYQANNPQAYRFCQLSLSRQAKALYAPDSQRRRETVC